MAAPIQPADQAMQAAQMDLMDDIVTIALCQAGYWDYVKKSLPVYDRYNDFFRETPYTTVFVLRYLTTLDVANQLSANEKQTHADVLRQFAAFVETRSKLAKGVRRMPHMWYILCNTTRMFFLTDDLWRAYEGEYCTEVQQALAHVCDFSHFTVGKLCADAIRATVATQCVSDDECTQLTNRIWFETCKSILEVVFFGTDKEGVQRGARALSLFGGMYVNYVAHKKFDQVRATYPEVIDALRDHFIEYYCAPRKHNQQPPASPAPPPLLPTTSVEM